MLIINNTNGIITNLFHFTFGFGFTVKKDNKILLIS